MAVITLLALLSLVRVLMFMTAKAFHGDFFIKPVRMTVSAGDFLVFA